MQFDVGKILTGKVTGITKYGVFVDIGAGKSGMVHISEVASTYVKEIRDFVTDGQEIKVKILGISEDGKISLSIKQAEDKPAFTASRGGNSAPRPRQYNNDRSFSGRNNNAAPAGPESFDDMLSRFMQSSDEKISSLRKNNGDRRSSRRGTNRG